MRNDKGFTLLEIVIILSVMAIIASVAIPNYMLTWKDKSLDADKMALFSLNDATKSLAMVQDVSLENIFNGYESNSDKMDYLVQNGFVISVPTPETIDAYFAWDTENTEWVLVCIDGSKKTSENLVLRYSSGESSSDNDNLYIDPDSIEDYCSDETYNRGDIVKYKGKIFVCSPKNDKKDTISDISPIKNSQINSNYWEEIELDD